MAEFMHEHMEQAKSTRLRFSEPAKDHLFGAVKRNPKPGEYLLVRIEIGRAQFNPKILRPCAEKNRARFLPVVKLVCAVVSRIGASENDALQPLAEAMRVGN
jgi:hypothetical protein